ncbi:MAG: hypothetical protein Q9191_001278 [Dirinaria sp. TL-2023a]
MTDGDFICSIESYVASHDRFRVVGYNIPRAYPMRMGASGQNIVDLVDKSVDAAAAQILQHYRIQASRAIYRRWRPLEEVMHTYLLETSDTDPSTWRQAAIEINHLFLNAGVPQEMIEVEIVNPSLSNHKTSTVLPSDPNILNALESTRSKTVNFLQAYAPSYWTSVAFHMRHNKFRPQEPKKPTILVFFRIAACTRFEYLEQELKKHLKHDLIAPFAIEFLSGEIDLGMDNPRPMLPRRPIGALPRNGDSLGVRGEKFEAGTLGGWLTLRWPGQTRRTKVAMTVFHLVSGQKTPDDPVLHPRAVDATTSSNKTQMEFPAAYDRKFAIEHYNDRLQGKLSQAQRMAYQKELDRLVKHDAKPVIGSVLYYSGVRKNSKGRRMDWALFETESTWTENIPPSAASFANPASRFPSSASAEVFYEPDASTRIRRFGKMQLGGWVVKSGRTTSDTSGEVNHLRRSINWQAHNRFISEEIEVMGLNSDFVDGGDSGSWVSNEEGELVGMLIAKDSNASNYNIGFVSDIGDIQEDFEALCGWTFTLP